MPRFRTTLVPGVKRPYASWTFLVVPAAAAARWGAGSHPLRGTIAGHDFRGTASRGEGVLRIPLARDFRERTGLAVGDVVEVTLELDAAPRPLHLPAELRAVLAAEPALTPLFDALPPSMRRAWCEYVGEAKQSETRARRAARALAGIRGRAYPP